MFTSMIPTVPEIAIGIPVEEQFLGKTSSRLLAK